MNEDATVYLENIVSIIVLIPNKDLKIVSSLNIILIIILLSRITVHSMSTEKAVMTVAIVIVV